MLPARLDNARAKGVENQREKRCNRKVMGMYDGDEACEAKMLRVDHQIPEVKIKRPRLVNVLGRRETQN